MSSCWQYFHRFVYVNELFLFLYFRRAKSDMLSSSHNPLFPFFKFPTSSLPFGCKTVPQEAFFFPPGSNMCLLHVSRWFDSDDIYSCGEHLSPSKNDKCPCAFYSFIYLFILMKVWHMLRCSRRTTMTRSDRSSWGSSRCSTAPRSRTEGGARRRGAHDRPPPHPWGKTQIKVCGEEKKIK